MSAEKIVGGVAIAAGVAGLGTAAYLWLRKERKAEVFAVGGPEGGPQFAGEEAAGVASRYGGRLATMTEMAEAQRSGASWCAPSWAAGDADDGMHLVVPADEDTVKSCPIPGLVVGLNEIAVQPSQTARVAVRGYKPSRAQGTDTMERWNDDKYSQWG